MTCGKNWYFDMLKHSFFKKVPANLGHIVLMITYILIDTNFKWITPYIMYIISWYLLKQHGIARAMLLFVLDVSPNMLGETKKCMWNVKNDFPRKSR
jgi:hypothetical protein